MRFRRKDRRKDRLARFGPFTKLRANAHPAQLFAWCLRQDAFFRRTLILAQTTEVACIQADFPGGEISVALFTEHSEMDTQ